MSKVVPRAELLPCPFCGGALVQREARVSNPHAECRTEGCYGAKMPVVNLDVHSDVAAWNTRAPTPPPATPVEGAGDASKQMPEAELDHIVNWLDGLIPGSLGGQKEVYAFSLAAIRSLRATSRRQAAEIAELRAAKERITEIAAYDLQHLDECRDDAKLWRFCEQSGFPHASYGPAPDGKWRTYWFHRKARGEEFDDPISSVRAAIAREGRSND